MPITVPDQKWYRNISAELELAPECPCANVHRCPRYFSSMGLLGKARMITAISEDKNSELEEFWRKTDLLPVVEEEDSSISGDERRWTCFSNFCPEVAGSYLGQYASYLCRHADEIDRDSGQRIALRDGIPGDWRGDWASVSACHYTQCRAYTQVKNFHDNSSQRNFGFAHANVLLLLKRMDQCLDAKDPTGVLHAAANIVETAAKDLLGDKSLANQTFGGFAQKYENESALPEKLKAVALEIYKLRNTMPLSGHGSTGVPDMTLHDAIVIAAATKFLVEVEYRSRRATAG